METESRALHGRVRAFIDKSLTAAACESFDSLACALARFQAEHVPVVRAAFRRAGIHPADLSSANQIPAIPTDIFRLRRVAAHPENLDTRVFETSGTTFGKPGHHAFRELDTYHHGALRWAEQMLWPDDPRLRVVLLACSEAQAPTSSLSYMLARFADRHGNGAWFWDGERLDLPGLVAALTIASNVPVLVAGTSFAFVHLCDTLSGPLPLPKGSRVMQTGGFKGRSREVAPTELRASLSKTFDLAENAIVAEYGMTELSSQLYQRLGDAGDRYLAPPWLRVEAACPETLALLPRGYEGIARFLDLANVDSSVGIQTADRVIVDEDGGVTLLGRLPGAPPRGCSLSIEHVLTADG